LPKAIVGNSSCRSLPNRLKESEWIGDQREDLQFWLKVSGFSSPKGHFVGHITLLDDSREAVDQWPFQQLEPNSLWLPKPLAPAESSHCKPFG